MKKGTLYLIVMLIGTACVGGIGAVINKNIIGHYFLVAPDVEEQLSICYHQHSDEDNYGIIIGETVFAVGYNNEYIIIKQHPNKSSDSLNKNKINYYILPVKDTMDWQTKNDLIGPLSLNQFEQLKKVYNLENVNFTIEYKELE